MVLVQIGTPLPALDSKEYDANEYKPVWEQEVRDEQGRRRFHGAFTGGFSAGYFNSVGSKEGQHHRPSSIFGSEVLTWLRHEQDGRPRRSAPHGRTRPLASSQPGKVTQKISWMKKICRS